MIALPSIALASDLVDISVEIDGWTMLPIADAGATTHIIATRDDDQALTTDIDIVLYEKTPTGWDGSAYDPSVSKEDAMVDLATEFGLADPFGGTWLIDLDPINATGAPVIPRQPFGKGFFMYDPLYFIANQLPNPDPLAQSAEAAGLPAGGGAINTGSVGGTNVGGAQSTNCGCDNGCIQYSIAAGADAFLADSTMTVETIDDVIGANYAARPGGGCCPEMTTCGQISNGPWYCTAWTFVGMESIEQLGYCVYTRNVFRIQTINCRKRCSDCLTTLNFTQNRQQFGDAFTHTGPTALPGDCVAPLRNPCNGSGVAEFATTGWSPPPPACP